MKTQLVISSIAQLYKTNQAIDAIKLGVSIDKSPSDLLNWIHWNNPSIFTNKAAINRGNKALCTSSKMLMAMYENTAHRSWYWSSQISGLAASVVNQQTSQGKLYPGYPNFLRRSGLTTRTTVVNRLAEISGASKSTVRDELLPILSTLHSETSSLGNIEDFSISMSLGLTGDEHAALCGLTKSRKSTKELVARYNLIESERTITSPIIVNDEEPESQLIEKATEEKANQGQRTLF